MRLLPIRIVRAKALDELREKADEASTLAVHLAAALFALQKMQEQQDEGDEFAARQGRG